MREHERMRVIVCVSVGLGGRADNRICGLGSGARPWMRDPYMPHYRLYDGTHTRAQCTGVCVPVFQFVGVPVRVCACAAVCQCACAVARDGLGYADGL